MKHTLNLVILIATSFICLLGFPPHAGLAATQFQITAPRANSVVPREVIEVSGVGADPTGTIEIEVLTNNWYLQVGTVRINSDGAWTFGPVHLAGEGQYNSHTIRATIVKGRRHLDSVTVSGIVRKQ